MKLSDIQDKDVVDLNTGLKIGNIVDYFLIMIL